MSIRLIYIDLFSGAGGTTTGIEQARVRGEKVAEVVACVNHDPHAIASHSANHMKAVHFTEDIRNLDTAPLKAVLEAAKIEHPDAKTVLWASCECTNFSKAKGGKPRDADSRTLAEHLYTYIEDLDPDFVAVENVEEFMCWGALDEHGKPVSWHKGCDYLKWVDTVCSYGYTHSWRLLNAADYGAYTSRKRYFAIFAKIGLKAAFPTADYSRDGGDSHNLFGFSYKKWKPVREVLDLDDAGESIFTRRKPLVENTLKRIYAGVIRFVAGGEKAFIAKRNSMESDGSYAAPSVGEPCPTLLEKDRMAKVTFIANEYTGGGQLSDLDHPNPAVLTTPKQKLVSCFLMNPQYGSAGGSVDKPCFTLIAGMDKMPPYLIATDEGVGIQIFDSDSPMTVKIKEVMAMYGIIDIRMRMFKISELKAIMGFPKDYVLVGTQSEQKKFIGNAVEVNMSRRLCEALAEAN